MHIQTRLWNQEERTQTRGFARRNPGCVWFMFLYLKPNDVLTKTLDTISVPNGKTYLPQTQSARPQHEDDCMQT